MRHRTTPLFVQISKKLYRAKLLEIHRFKSGGYCCDIRFPIQVHLWVNDSLLKITNLKKEQNDSQNGNLNKHQQINLVNCLYTTHYWRNCSN
ncbi:hypothetical protein C0J52_08276 [Blattella germanica]|nr:hypothetical protein C0J52_08276 [Blattella germanica]